MTDDEIAELEREWVPCVDGVGTDGVAPERVSIQADGLTDELHFAIELALRLRRMAVKHEMDVPLITVRIQIGTQEYDIHFETAGD